MKPNAALTLVALALPAAMACTETKIIQQAAPSQADAGAGDAGEAAEPTRVEGPSGKVFGATASSFAKTDADGRVVAVGVTIPLAAFEDAPSSHPFQDDLVLEMPEVAKEQTIVHHLRLNWLASGHGPDPYGDPHFDLHFLRGSVEEVDAIDCRADKRLPTADKLPAGYGKPELCVNAMGYHSWPKADLEPGADFTASIIMGYFAGNVVFIEPMIAKSALMKKKTFELPIAKPQSAGGATTLYPTHMAATWDADAETYTFELDQLETID